MGGADDIINSAFGKESEIKKLENFEVSTLKLVLRQLGWTAAEVAAKANELGAGFGWDWFNDEGLIRAQVFSTREFSFNFWELLTKPTRHPIVEAYSREYNPLEARVMVFGVYDHGRWVATNVSETSCSLIRVVPHGTDSFSVLPFAQFFNRWKPE